MFKNKDKATKRKQGEGNIKCERIVKDSYGAKIYVRHDLAFRRMAGLCHYGTAPMQERHLTFGDFPLYIW